MRRVIVEVPFRQGKVGISWPRHLVALVLTEEVHLHTVVANGLRLEFVDHIREVVCTQSEPLVLFEAGNDEVVWEQPELHMGEMLGNMSRRLRIRMFRGRTSGSDGLTVSSWLLSVS